MNAIRFPMVAIAAGMIIAAIVGGCNTPPAGSGFIEDTSAMQQSQHDKLAYLQWNPSRNLSDYTSVMVDPVIVYFNADTESEPMNPADLSRLATYMQDALVGSLADRYRIAHAPGEGVLRIRAAMANVRRKQIVMNVEPASQLTGVGLPGATLEVKVLDSMSGEVVAATMLQNKPDPRRAKPGAYAFSYAAEIMDTWAQGFRARLEEAHDQQRVAVTAGDEK